MKKTIEVVIALLIQNAAVFAAVMFFMAALEFLPRTPVMATRLVEGAETMPWTGRLIFMVIAFALALLGLVLARKLGTWLAFLVANLAGILLWQSIGECAWHFGFARMEGGECGIWILMTILTLGYAGRRRYFDWHVWVFILSFMVNWFCHFVMEGTYVLAPAGMAEETWYKVSGIPVMILVLILVLANHRRFRTTRENLIFSQLLFLGLGIIPGAFGIF